MPGWMPIAKTLDAGDEPDKRAAAFWWARYWRDVRGERPKATDAAVEEYAQEYERLLSERDALTAQLKATGHVPYLERMSELAKRAETAEEELTTARADIARLQSLLASECRDWAEFDDLLDEAGAPQGDQYGRPATIERLEWLKARAERAAKALANLLAVIGTTPSGFLSLVDDDASREAVSNARIELSIALAAPAAEGAGE